LAKNVEDEEALPRPGKFSEEANSQRLLYYIVLS